MVTLRGRLEPEVGAVLVQALAAAREALYQGLRALVRKLPRVRGARQEGGDLDEHPGT